jgi:hypothetical protein
MRQTYRDRYSWVVHIIDPASLQDTLPSVEKIEKDKIIKNKANMAKLYPSMDIINKRKPVPTEGEKALINFLYLTQL